MINRKQGELLSDLSGNFIHESGYGVPFLGLTRDMTREPKQRGNAQFTPCFKNHSKELLNSDTNGLRCSRGGKWTDFNQKMSH